MRKVIVLISTWSFFVLTGCSNHSTNNTETSGVVDSATIDGHPAWIEQGNVYEVNVRQYTPEGTFRAFEKSLDRLKDMGVQTLWFMPLNPISVKDRKGPLGSYYAVSDYKGVNPEYGTMDDWKSLVKNAHDKGFKVIIDWVPNHTGADHPWLTSHPEFYKRDSITHQPLSPFDWTDVRQLDFTNHEMFDSMTAAMEFWVRETDIDGFRCDHVEEFQKDFWKQCIPKLRSMKNLFLLSENNAPWVYATGFDATYPWDAFNTMKLIAKGQRPAFSLDSVLKKEDSTYPKSAIRLYFTSNHDENSWNRADFQTMPGPIHAPFAVLTQTFNHSVPLIYSGQEEPFLDSVSFFYKDTITFGKYQRAPFYKTLLQLRKENPALAANAPFIKLRTDKEPSIYAYERGGTSNKVLVILNLSGAQQNFKWVDQPSEKQWNNVFGGNPETIKDTFGLQPWGYAVYELRK